MKNLRFRLHSRSHSLPQRTHGFTLIEVLITLVLLAALALMSYRSLDVVLTARDRVSTETLKWQQLGAFVDRFKQDVQMAAPYAVRNEGLLLPAWQGRAADDTSGPALEFSRFAAVPGQDRPRRVAYTLNDAAELELWLWPGLEQPPAIEPERHVVLSGVTAAVFEYLSADLQWVPVWPLLPTDAAIPRAVRLRIELSNGEVFVRMFALNT